MKRRMEEAAVSPTSMGDVERVDPWRVVPGGVAVVVIVGPVADVVLAASMVIVAVVADVVVAVVV